MASYFSAQSFHFLKQLAAHNERPWFNVHKQEYEDLVRTPALHFIEDMGDELVQVSPHFRAIAKKQGGSLMRVYRDARFSKNKLPFKTNVGIQFRHELSKDAHSPAFYLHIEPGNNFAGVGIWRPESRALRRIRETIADNHNAWKQATRDEHFLQRFELVGERLTNPPRGYKKDHPLIEDLKYKDFIAVSRLSDEAICGDDLLEQVVARYRLGAPLMKFLCFALELNF